MFADMMIESIAKDIEKEIDKARAEGKSEEYIQGLLRAKEITEGKY